MTAHERGIKGEELAAQFLIYKGYQVIERNYRCRYGEIDIIAADGEDTVFVEVKTRKNAHFSAARDSVTPAKIRRLKASALMWLSENGERPARFDVVEIYLGDGKPEIHLIKNAITD